MSKNDNILRFAEVRRRVPLNRATIYRKMANETFPPSVPLSVDGSGRATAVGWYERDIEAYIANPADWRAAQL